MSRTRFNPFTHAPVPLEGKTVLVNGAGGGVGPSGGSGGQMEGRTRHRRRLWQARGLLRDSGADQFIDYTKTAA